MVVLKTSGELALMREAGRLSAQALQVGGKLVHPGITTGEIDRAIHHFIKSQGATPSFLGFGGFPASACISINNEVIHGIPGDRVLQEGDLVSIDVGAIYKGYHGDNAYTFACGQISQDCQNLLDVTRESLNRAIAAAVTGARLGDISWAVQSYAESFGYGIVKQYVGHGIGTQMHQDPEVPNFGKPGRGIRLLPGMTLAIEPMVNMVGEGIKNLSDGWTVVTASGSPSAHFEHTVAITDNGPMILTLA